MEETLNNENMIKKPFVTYTLDEDKEESNSETLTIRINKEERERLELMKHIWSYGSDAKILKMGLIVFQNVTLTNFGSDFIKKVTDERRRRPVSKFKIVDGKLSNL
jgi:hypothetical protein